MFSRSSRRASLRSITGRPVQLESLEGRRFLSASSITSDVLDVDGSTDDFKPGFVTESVNPIKIEGTFTGHYVSDRFGKNTLEFVITRDTHTGHFTGTFSVQTPSGKLTATAKGVIKVSKHVTVTLSGSQITGTFTGNASHTGGSFFGSYSVQGKIFGSDTGTYHVGKA